MVSVLGEISHVNVCIGQGVRVQVGWLVQAFYLVLAFEVLDAGHRFHGDVDALKFTLVDISPC